MVSESSGAQQRHCSLFSSRVAGSSQSGAEWAMAVTTLIAHASFRHPSKLPFPRRPHSTPAPTPPSVVTVVSKRPRFLVACGDRYLEVAAAAAAVFFSPTTTNGSLRVRRFVNRATGIVRASTPGVSPSGGDGVNETFEGWNVETSNSGTSFLAKLAIALGIAATITMMSIYFKWPTPGSAFKFPFSVDGSLPLVPPTSAVGFTLTVFGHRVVLPEYTPGWVYFWLLMAAGCGLFISEEALNVWVGISLARMLSLDGSWKSFVQSFSNNAPYIISTVLWVYWGVCISDMIPFYLGKFFRQTKASEDICSKLGIGREKAERITRVVQKYGNLSGFVERFSLGVRNPTSFLAGACGISSECFFAGVCCGGLITLPIQLGIGFLLRERPVVAIASVATAVGMWTVFPYLLAASTALFLFLRRRQSN